MNAPGVRGESLLRAHVGVRARTMLRHTEIASLPAFSASGGRKNPMRPPPIEGYESGKRSVSHIRRSQLARAYGAAHDQAMIFQPPVPLLNANENAARVSCIGLPFCFHE